MKKISILLVDDHTLFREGLAGLLRRKPDLEVVGSASNGAEGLNLARELMPDLILMDVNMAEMSGLEATRRIKAEMPDIRIVMVTMSEDDRDLFEAIKSGAQGYILKNTSPADLFKFIDGVFAGETPISGLMATKMLHEFKRPVEHSRAEEPSIEELTEREVEVLQRVADGLSNREIAGALNISENTVKKHYRNIMAKLHVQNRVQAALYGIQQRELRK